MVCAALAPSAPMPRLWWSLGGCLAAGGRRHGPRLVAAGCGSSVERVSARPGAPQTKSVCVKTCVPRYVERASWLGSLSGPQHPIISASALHGKRASAAFCAYSAAIKVAAAAVQRVQRPAAPALLCGEVGGGASGSSTCRLACSLIITTDHSACAVCNPHHLSGPGLSSQARLCSSSWPVMTEREPQVEHARTLRGR